MQQMQQQYVQGSCNKEGAFQKGYNDANQDGQMDGGWARMCPPESQTMVRQQYQKGFMNAQANKPVQINIGFGGHGAGYMCKENFGKKICGYNCLEAYTKVRCAQQADHNCIESYGNIICGLHCREEYGRAQCDEYE